MANKLTSFLSGIRSWMGGFSWFGRKKPTTDKDKNQNAALNVAKSTKAQSAELDRVLQTVFDKNHSKTTLLKDLPKIEKPQDKADVISACTQCFELFQDSITKRTVVNFCIDNMYALSQEKRNEVIDFCVQQQDHIPKDKVQDVINAVVTKDHKKKAAPSINKKNFIQFCLQNSSDMDHKPEFIEWRLKNQETTSLDSLESQAEDRMSFIKFCLENQKSIPESIAEGFLQFCLLNTQSIPSDHRAEFIQYGLMNINNMPKDKTMDFIQFGLKYQDKVPKDNISQFLTMCIEQRKNIPDGSARDFFSFCIKNQEKLSDTEKAQFVKWCIKSGSKVVGDHDKTALIKFCIENTDKITAKKRESFIKFCLKNPEHVPRDKNADAFINFCIAHEGNITDKAQFFTLCIARQDHMQNKTQFINWCLNNVSNISDKAKFIDFCIKNTSSIGTDTQRILLDFCVQHKDLIPVDSKKNFLHFCISNPNLNSSKLSALMHYARNNLGFLEDEQDTMKVVDYFLEQDQSNGKKISSKPSKDKEQDTKKDKVASKDAKKTNTKDDKKNNITANAKEETSRDLDSQKALVMHAISKSNTCLNNTKHPEKLINFCIKYQQDILKNNTQMFVIFCLEHQDKIPEEHKKSVLKLLAQNLIKTPLYMNFCMDNLSEMEPNDQKDFLNTCIKHKEYIKPEKLNQLIKLSLQNSDKIDDPLQFAIWASNNKDKLTQKNKIALINFCITHYKNNTFNSKARAKQEGKFIDLFVEVENTLPPVVQKEFAMFCIRNDILDSSNKENKASLFNSCFTKHSEEVRGWEHWKSFCREHGGAKGKQYLADMQEKQNITADKHIISNIQHAIDNLNKLQNSENYDHNTHLACVNEVLNECLQLEKLKLENENKQSPIHMIDFAMNYEQDINNIHNGQEVLRRL